ncbi:MAG: hypothetical protein GX444_08770 [Myxococcales bacterium]|nr:hypothetical protein [Myxococcales bacterium]
MICMLLVGSGANPKRLNRYFVQWGDNEKKQYAQGNEKNTETRCDKKAFPE